MLRGPPSVEEVEELTNNDENAPNQVLKNFNPSFNQTFIPSSCSFPSFPARYPNPSTTSPQSPFNTSSASPPAKTPTAPRTISKAVELGAKRTRPRSGGSSRRISAKERGGMGVSEREEGMGM